MRIKVETPNFKYLNKGNIVHFWDQAGGDPKCRSRVLGKSREYLLLRVFQVNACERAFSLKEGSYLWLRSEDLVENMKVGREMTEILLKKKLAIKGMTSEVGRNLQIHREKLDAVNMRYRTLREKLEAEWRETLEALEQERLADLQKYQKFQKRLKEINRKLERYRIEDGNLKEDRWALDSKLYFEK